MRGLVLAAGRGTRLGFLTARLPKALLDVGPVRTILDLILSNLRTAGITEVGIVVGFAAEAIAERREALEHTHGIAITLIPNDRGHTWNNAYSLWLATDWIVEDTMMVNGDTVHPPAVEESLIRAVAVRDWHLAVAVDTVKPLGAEEMKVVLEADATIRRITKNVPPARAAGEYIGVSLIRTAGVPALRAALEAAWRASPDHYYEDGYQVYIDRGHAIGAVPIGTLDWIEVDTPADLARAREVACRY